MPESVAVAAPIVRSRRLQDLKEPFAGAALVLTGSLANMLAYHRYPGLRPEVGLVGLALLAVAFVFALLHAGSGRIGKALLDALLVYLAVDLNSDLNLLSALLAALALGLRLWRGWSLLIPLSIMAVVVFLSSVVGLSEGRSSLAVSQGDASAPRRHDAVLHILLDEHGGTGGTKDSALRHDLVRFYTDHGFRLYDRAYSRHFHTVNAVPDALNFGGSGANRTVGRSLDVGRTRYFDELAKRGYRLNFYQSDFADYCRYARHGSCTTYWSPSLQFVADAEVSAGSKARLIGYKLAGLSGLLVVGGNMFNVVRNILHLQNWDTGPFDIYRNGLSSSVSAFAALDRMQSDLAKAQPGNVYFAHILAPHYPYVMSSNCTMRPTSEWEYRRSFRPLEQRQRAYAEQSRCLMSRLNGVLAAFLASPAGRRATIVIHGDHGNRLTEVEPGDWNRGRIPPADFRAGYSTLFAVRAPDVSSGIESAPAATPDLLATLSANDFLSMKGLQRGDEQVFLDGRDWSVGGKASIKGMWAGD